MKTKKVPILLTALSLTAAPVAFAVDSTSGMNHSTTGTNSGMTDTTYTGDAQRGTMGTSNTSGTTGTSNTTGTTTDISRQSSSDRAAMSNDAHNGPSVIGVLAIIVALGLIAFGVRSYRQQHHTTA